MNISDKEELPLDYLVVIPARLSSTRFPRKPLFDLLGQSLLERTYRQCALAVSEDRIVVATDHSDIVSHCQQRDMNVVLTSEKCLTGTDRVAEVSERISAHVYINVQGDEPLIKPENIERVIQECKKFPDDVINGFAPIEDEIMYRSLTIPKVVTRPDGRLLYMSRSPIPGSKKDEFTNAWRQICVYGFPKNALLEFAALKEKTPLENNEDIEILRFLEMGYEVRMIELSGDSLAVDTPEDAEEVIKVLKTMNK